MMNIFYDVIHCQIIRRQNKHYIIDREFVDYNYDYDISVQLYNTMTNYKIMLVCLPFSFQLCHR